MLLRRKAKCVSTVFPPTSPLTSISSILQEKKPLYAEYGLYHTVTLVEAKKASGHRTEPRPDYLVTQRHVKERLQLEGSAIIN